MISTLIPIAVWTHLVVFQAASMHFHFDVAKSTPAPGPVNQQLIIRETTLSEKCWLGVETVARPDEELAAIRVETSQLQSVVGSCQSPPKTSWETPNFHNRFLPDWNKQFALNWDDDGGYHFGKKYFPNDSIEVEGGRFRRGGFSLGQELDR